VIEKNVDVATRDGRMTTFACHPDRNQPHPVVVFFMDAWGIREELRDMARRYATVGYYVVLPNLYYRAGIVEPGPIPHWDGTGEPPHTPVTEARAELTIAKVVADTQSLLRDVQADGAAKPGAAGCVGYCMSAQFALNAAARLSRRIAATASIYGTALMTDHRDSPHLAARRAKGELYFACAEKDPWTPLPVVRKLAAGFEDAGLEAEVEIYPGTEHGFAFPERPTYDKASAERHWERVLALFRRRLG
jgi:carboxymethylenebutenolidase